MKKTILLLLTALITSCTTSDPEPERTERLVYKIYFSRDYQKEVIVPEATDIQIWSQDGTNILRYKIGSGKSIHISTTAVIEIIEPDIYGN